jgi:pre-mRNA-processing factor 19
MSFVCEISGESLSTAADEVVVTPSGHVCLKRLLLSKLSENGGMDPWVEGRPLSEDQLITLSGNNSKTLPPRPQQATSMPSLLTLLSKEYDALVLELFDTRKALEDTRRELSQALYQNDAAIRVVARLAQERDAAQAQLEQWNGSVGAAASAPTTAAAQDTNGDEEEPPTKRQKLSDGPLKGDIPEADLKIMTDTWETLHKERKPTLKAAAAEAPTPEVLATFEETDHKAWHKSTCKAVTCMSQCEEASLLVTGAKDKHVCLYNTESQVVAHDINFGTIPAAVAVNASYFAAGDGKGKLVIYKVDDGSVAVEFKGDSAVVDLSFHPSGKFLVAASAAGRVSIYSLDGEDIAEMSYFEAEEDIEYESGALHPDGLIYAAGTKSGAVHIWDFKNKTLASTMKVSPNK